MAKIVVLGTSHPHVFSVAATACDTAGAKLLGVYEPDANLALTASERLGLLVSENLDELLSQSPDLALIGAVPSQRVELAIKAMHAGAAVLVDKPLALTTSELDQLIQASEQTQKPVMVYYPYRGDPCVQAAKEALDQGRIGQLVRVFSSGPHKLNPELRPDWHWTKADNGGIHIDIGSHHFDICCWFADAKPVWLNALAHNFSQPNKLEFQDFGQAMLRFDNGVYGHVEIDWLNPASIKHFGDTRMWLQGSCGKIEMRMGDIISAQIWDATANGEDLDTTKFPTAQQWDAKLIDDLLTGKPCCMSQESIWQTSRVTLLAQISAEQGGQPVIIN